MAATATTSNFVPPTPTGAGARIAPPPLAASVPVAVSTSMIVTTPTSQPTQQVAVPPAPSQLHHQVIGAQPQVMAPTQVAPQALRHHHHPHAMHGGGPPPRMIAAAHHHVVAPPGHHLTQAPPPLVTATVMTPNGVVPIVAAQPQQIPIQPCRMTSPFDPSTSGVTTATTQVITAGNGNTTTISGNGCPQDSDCGSSSGLGGMKNQEMASEEGGSSSGGSAGSAGGGSSPRTHQLPYHPAYRPPIPATPMMPPVVGGAVPGANSGGPPGSGMPHVLPMPVRINHHIKNFLLPAWVQPIPAGSNNDLFVHLLEGETLGIVVGQELQNITGPATIRMAGEYGIAPTAVPLDMPKGHVIHQIVDELGYVKHMILSPENIHPNQFYCRDHNAHHGRPCGYQASFYTINRKWNNGEPTARCTTTGGVANGSGKSPPMSERPSTRTDEETEPAELDPEEVDRLREMLNRIMTPTIVHISSHEATVQWQEIDTSEAAAPGGPFPQIDASEFTYHIVLYENQGRQIDSFRCNPIQNGNNGNIHKIGNLHPNTEYYVQLKASLEERDLHGEPSSPVPFRTMAGRPSPPQSARIVYKSTDHVVLHWNPPLFDNGAPVQYYTVYISKSNRSNDEHVPNEKAIETKVCETKISGLHPSTSYRVRVRAMNKVGESDDAPNLKDFWTDRVNELPKPSPPSFVTAGTRFIKLQWAAMKDVQWGLEMQEPNSSIVTTLGQHLNRAYFNVSDLQPGTEYHFRLFYYRPQSNQESPRSDWMIARTGRPEPRQERAAIVTTIQPTGSAPSTAASPLMMQPLVIERLIVPTRPFVVSHTPGSAKTEIAWRCVGARDREFTYQLEGSSRQQPARYRILQKSSASNYLVTEEDLANFRVASINRKNAMSDYSDVLVLPLDEERISKPAQLVPPTLTTEGRGCLRVCWIPLRADAVPSECSLMYEIRRVDGKTEMVYSGAETSFILKGLPHKHLVEVQARGVIVDADGGRHEGPWSAVGGGTTLRDVPKPPANLKINTEKTHLIWSSGDASPIDVRYKVRFARIPDETNNDEVAEERLEEQAEEDLVVLESTECRQNLKALAPATMYRCTVSAYHEGGESAASDELSFATLASTPGAPEAVSIEAMSTSQLRIRWTAPDPRGAPIQQYQLRVESRGEVVNESSIAASSECEHCIDGLQADTPYRVELSAENEIGRGQTVSIAGRTRCPPPEAPRLYADSEVTSLKLKWKNVGTHKSIIYKVVRLLENDSKQVVYEGENTTTRVKNLTEDSEYRFQIRSSDRQTGVGPWSEVFAFRTLVSPPPSVKTAPTATQTATGNYTIEWQSVFGKSTAEKRFAYRLQAVDCSIEKAKWHTVYEGDQPRYSFRTSDYPSAIQVRILTVRLDGETEILGTASPLVYIANQKIDKVGESGSQSETDAQAASTSGKTGFLSSLWATKSATTSWLPPAVLPRTELSLTTLVVILFIVVSFLVALLCDWVFNLQTLSPAGTNPDGTFSQGATGARASRGL